MVFKSNGVTICNNCNKPLKPASLVKLIPFFTLYSRNSSGVTEAKLHRSEAGIDVELPIDPTLTSGDLFNILNLFPENSKVNIYLPTLKVSSWQAGLLNLNTQTFYPIDFGNQFQMSLNSIKRSYLQDYLKPIIKICKELKLSCQIKKDLALEKPSIKFPINSYDKIFRAISSYSNNFVTLASLALYSETLDLNDAQNNIIKNLSKDFPNSSIVELTGLSADNRVSCSDILKFFKKNISHFPESLHFFKVSKSYPVFKHLSANDTLYAKTGSLLGVSALVGVRILNQKRDYFCIIQNCSNCSFDLKSKESEILVNLLNK